MIEAKFVKFHMTRHSRIIDLSANQSTFLPARRDLTISQDEDARRNFDSIDEAIRWICKN